MSIQPTTAEGANDIDVKSLKARHQKPSPQPYKQQGQCGYYGSQHQPPQRCPAIGAECHKCGHRNHFTRACQSGTLKTCPKTQELDNECSSSEDELLIALIEGTTCKDWNATVTINSKNIAFKIDTGVQCNVMSSKPMITSLNNR